MEESKKLIKSSGQVIGRLIEIKQLAKGALAIVEREERLGGGKIVLPMRELDESGDCYDAPYDELSTREAPPYSINVNLESYLEYWRRLADINYSSSATSFLPTGSGLIEGDHPEVSDEQIEKHVKEKLRAARSEGVHSRVIRVTVKNGTVVLEGHQNDTPTRLAAARAAASVLGVREIVNMLVIRAEI